MGKEGAERPIYDVEGVADTAIILEKNIVLHVDSVDLKS